MNQRPTIFFYPAWYPHRGDSMFGLFVKRHAEAVSAFAKVGVVFAIGDSTITGGAFEIISTNQNNVETVHVYFKKSTTKGIASFINGWRYIQAVRKGYCALKHTIGKPHVNHVHILTRAGLYPLWKKWMGGTPYIITEHWSRYLPINEGAYSGAIRKWLTKIIVKNAYAVTPVSQRLADAMQSHGLKHDNYVLVNNVVDTERFVPQKKSNTCLRWIHVSCFDEHPKNITGLLTGFEKAHRMNPNLHLTMVGNGIDWESSKKFAEQLGLDNSAVTFTGLLEGEALQTAFQNHDAFVMFSRYENQPVVIIEAFACGLPVVATAVGSIPEMLANHRGICIPSENVDALADAIQILSTASVDFSREEIRDYAVQHFSFSAVGKRFYELYLAAIENKNS